MHVWWDVPWPWLWMSSRLDGWGGWFGVSGLIAGVITLRRDGREVKGGWWLTQPDHQSRGEAGSGKRRPQIGLAVVLGARAIWNGGWLGGDR